MPTRQLLEKIEALKAENAKLRAALDQYADKSNWDLPDYIWIGESSPIDLAQSALRWDEGGEE
jgi:hypothetical protein